MGGINIGRRERNEGGKGMGSACTPRQVPSNFSAVVAPILESGLVQSCPWVGLTHGLGRVGSRFSVFGGLG